MQNHSNLFMNEPFGFSSENLRTSLQPFRSYFKEITLKKNDFLVKQGEICRYFCFIDEGVLHHTIEIDNQEKNHLFRFKKYSNRSIKQFFTTTAFS